MQQYFTFDLINAYSNDRCIYTEQISVDDSLAQTLRLEIENTSDTDIVFEALKDDPAKDNYHFALFFRAGVLSNYSVLKHPATQTTGTFKMSQATPGGFKDSYYFYFISTQEVFKKGEILSIELKQFAAEDRKSEHSTSISLEGDSMSQNGSSINASRLKAKSNLTIKNSLINRKLPLHFSFRGHNTVLNEEATPNQLKLSVVNTAVVEDESIKSAGKIVFTPESRISVGFDVQSAQKNRPWALGKDTVLRDCSVTFPADWKQEEEAIINEAGKLVWTFSPKQKVTISSLQEMLITIDGIKTGLDSGYTNLIFSYTDVLNYGNGQFLVPILKTPLITRGAKVGIGVEPTSTLDIGGRGDNTIELRVNGRIASTGTGGGMWVDPPNQPTSAFVGSNHNQGIMLWTNNTLGLEVDKSSNTNISGKLTVGDDTTLNQGLTVSKNTSISQGLTVGKDASIHGSASVNGSLTVGSKGDSTIELTVNGRIMSKGKESGVWLDGDQKTFIGSDGKQGAVIWTANRNALVVDMNANTNIAGKLTVGGDIDFNGKLLQNGSSPIEYEQFTFEIGGGKGNSVHYSVDDQSRYAIGKNWVCTNRQVSEYIGIVAGYNIINWDVYERERSAFSVRIAPDQKFTNLWSVYVELPFDQWNSTPLTKVTVDCVFIKKALVTTF